MFGDIFQYLTEGEAIYCNAICVFIHASGSGDVHVGQSVIS